jgi:hypothetical protein
MIHSSPAAPLQGLLGVRGRDAHLISAYSFCQSGANKLFLVGRFNKINVAYYVH